MHLDETDAQPPLLLQIFWTVKGALQDQIQETPKLAQCLCTVLPALFITLHFLSKRAITCYLDALGTFFGYSRQFSLWLIPCARRPNHTFYRSHLMLHYLGCKIPKYHSTQGFSLAFQLDCIKYMQNSTYVFNNRFSH